MWLIKLSWKNLWRNRSRTLITVAAIFFAVILSIIAESLKQGVFDNLVKNVVSFHTGYIQVHKSGYFDEQILDNSMQQTTRIEQAIESTEDIAAISPRIESFALVSADEKTTGCMVTGIDPEKETRITALKNKLTAGRYIEKNDHAVLLAEGLADQMKVIVGDTIVLIGQGYHGATAAGKFSVKGILKFGSPQLNKKMLYLPLAKAQELFGAEERITSYVATLEGDNRLDATAKALQNAIGREYEVMTWKELLPDIRQHIETDSNNMKIVQGVLYLLICFGIFSTLLMMMLERKFELGMLMAIGMKKARLITLLAIESVLTVFIGCIAGMVISVPLIYYLKNNPIRIGGETAKAYERFGFEAIFPTSTESSIFFNQGLVVLLIGLVLSLYPALKIMRLNPLEAMRK